MRQSRRPGYEYQLAPGHLREASTVGKGTNEIIQLDGRDTSVDTANDLLRDLDGVDMVHVQTVAQPRDTRGDLVELDALLASIWADISV